MKQNMKTAEELERLAQRADRDAEEWDRWAEKEKVYGNERGTRTARETADEYRATATALRECLPAAGQVADLHEAQALLAFIDAHAQPIGMGGEPGGSVSNQQGGSYAVDLRVYDGRAREYVWLNLTADARQLMHEEDAVLSATRNTSGRTTADYSEEYEAD